MLRSRCDGSRQRDGDRSDKLAVRALVLSLLSLASGALFAQKVTVEPDHAVDSSRFKTYAWTVPFQAQRFSS